MGELLTRGYSVMIGYWGDPELTSESLDSDGWMHTGTSPQLMKMVIATSLPAQRHGDSCGENIYPREIEEFLYPTSEDSGCPGDRST
jgi:fatty-acyl-CoA synthase